LAQRHRQQSNLHNKRSRSSWKTLLQLKANNTYLHLNTAKEEATLSQKTTTATPSFIEKNATFIEKTASFMKKNATFIEKTASFMKKTATLSKKAATERSEVEKMKDY
jgi:hypothetical protein